MFAMKWNDTNIDTSKQTLIAILKDLLSKIVERIKDEWVGIARRLMAWWCIASLLTILIKPAMSMMMMIVRVDVDHRLN